MMIQAKFSLTEPDDVEATLCLTMPLGHWKSLLLKVNEQSYPAGVLGAAVRKMIQKAEKAFRTVGEYDDD